MGRKSRLTLIVRNIVAALMVVFGLEMMAEWVIGYNFFKSLGGSVSVMFTTSLAICLAGIALLANGFPRFRVCDHITVIACGSLFFCMTLQLPEVFGYSIGIRELGGPDHAVPETKPVLPGLPSYGTMICFTVISIATFMEMFGIKVRQLSAIPWSIGSVSLIGYWASKPHLYWEIPNISTGMSPMTCVSVLIFATMLWVIPDDSHAQ